MTSLARREREALADLFDELGPDQPTLCGDWTTRDLAAHLVVRERRVDASPGIVLSPFAGWTEKVRRSYAGKPWPELVHLVRTGPGPTSPFSLPGVDKMLNTTEFVVHHEDVRRAQPGWRPRALPARVQDALWKAVSGRAVLALRGLRCRVELRRTDEPGSAPSAHGSGSSTATVAGEPLEVLLFLFGRREHARVDISGDGDAVTELEHHQLAV